jgi:energy-converting hydrogenase Eha subunit A
MLVGIVLAILLVAAAVAILFGLPLLARWRRPRQPNSPMIVFPKPGKQDSDS